MTRVWQRMRFFLTCFCKMTCRMNPSWLPFLETAVLPFPVQWSEIVLTLRLLSPSLYFGKSLGLLLLKYLWNIVRIMLVIFFKCSWINARGFSHECTGELFLQHLCEWPRSTRLSYKSAHCWIVCSPGWVWSKYSSMSFNTEHLQWRWRVVLCCGTLRVVCMLITGDIKLQACILWSHWTADVSSVVDDYYLDERFF